MKKYFGFIVIASIFMNGCVYHNFKSMPQGTNLASEVYQISEDQIDFLYDLTYMEEGERVSEQEIFDTVFTYIDSAKTYILVDMFLYNSYIGKAEKSFRQITEELTDNLIKKADQGVTIDFITDPINIVYGGDQSPELEKMKAAGINVIYTDLNKLPDSNLLYSPIWRTFFSWTGNKVNSGIFPHPFASDSSKVTLRSYLRMANFKANHRKTFVADLGDSWVSMVISANPHDGSSAHSNVGMLIKGSFAEEIYLAEEAVAKFSKKSLSSTVETERGRNGDLLLQLITEQEIKQKLILEINNTTINDSIKIGMFYLSDRDVIKALLKASEKGVTIKMILDPNIDAFGRKKNGIPNRPVAYELIHKSDKKIKVRWYNTNGEQFHSKFAFFHRAFGNSSLVIGSANFTRRNIGNKNLEMDLLLEANSDTEFMLEINQYYQLIWQNEKYSADYSKYAEKSIWKKMLYRFTEAFGASTY